ncbi:MAG: hypothetical protein H7263_11400 [Candidatus Sericytochromatia bacterium]|nr:hypothetical protein [Candidatus Sericytochromatia bacterium]
MARNITKLVSSIVLLSLSLTACGTNTEQTLLTTEQQAQTVSTFSVVTPSAPEILSQIQPSAIETTDWGVHVKALPLIKAQKKVTLLSYMAFDNDKGGYRNELVPMLNFHELSGTSSIMNMVLQTDSAEENDTKRYLVIGDGDSSKIVSPYTQFTKEQDSGDYKVLQRFVKWGFSSYSSQIKILDIDNHGGAFMGIAKDDTSSSLISLPNLAKGIKAGINHLDILNMDACLMGTIEAAYELRDVADVTIGSEDSTLATGMMYTKSLPTILAQSKNTEAIAINIILDSDRNGKDFLRRPNKKGKIPDIFTIAAYRSSAMKPLITELNNLSQILISKLPAQKQAINVAISGTHPLNVDGDDMGGQRDLYELLARLNTIMTDPAIKTAIARTHDALNKSIVIARIHNAEKHAQGLAINVSASQVQTDTYQATAFAKDSKWDELIVALSK